MTSHVSLVEVMGSGSADSGPSSFLEDLNHRLTQKEDENRRRVGEKRAGGVTLGDDSTSVC